MIAAVNGRRTGRQPARERGVASGGGVRACSAQRRVELGDWLELAGHEACAVAASPLADQVALLGSDGALLLARPDRGKQAAKLAQWVGDIPLLSHVRCTALRAAYWRPKARKGGGGGLR